MRSIDSMLDEYEESHQNSTNLLIHKLCVPAIMFSLLGLLWAIPVPASFMEVSPYLNWSTIFAAFCFVYYAALSMKYFVIVSPFVALMVYGNFLIAQSGTLLTTSIVIFILSWVIQIWGHKIEGKKPSFMKDLLFLLIGPLFVVKKIFKLS